METRGVMADAGAAPEAATLWSSTQFPHLLRARLAGILGWPAERLRVIAPDVGGGFGVKEAVYVEEVLALLLSKRLGRPVRWIEDRAEHFAATTHGREQVHHLEAAVAEDGTVTGLKSVCLTSIGGAYASLSNAPGFYVSAILRGPYRIPNYRSEVFSVVTNKTPLNVYRGAGHPQAVFCMERLMDRIRVIYDSGDYPACLRQALELMKYADFPAEQEKARAAGKYLGLGLSFYIETTALGPYETATLRVGEDERITLLTGTSPHGQGTATTHAQMVAEELGVAIDTITVLHGDTAIVRDGIGTWGSRGGAIGGTAARLAAIKLKDKARKLAAFLLHAAESELEWTAGQVHVRGQPGKGFSLGDLVRESKAANQFPPELDLTLEGDVKFEVPDAAYAYACHLAVVEVDAATGRVYVRRYGVAHDCGRVINPVIVAGQVVGGVAQGIGGTLLENLLYDEKGRLLTTSMMDYLLPSVFDIPPIELAHMETPTPHNPYGIKGAGEGGATGSPAALVSAIEDALAPFGVRLNDDGPFTPTRVLEELEKARNLTPPAR
jgi:carbon-monoxide dehydrogenase large subunit